MVGQGQNCLKLSKIVQNGPKWFKIVQNCTKWSKIVIMVKNSVSDLKRDRRTGLSTRRARRPKSRGPKGLQTSSWFIFNLLIWILDYWFVDVSCFTYSWASGDICQDAQQGYPKIKIRKSLIVRPIVIKVRTHVCLLLPTEIWLIRISCFSQWGGWGQ